MLLTTTRLTACAVCVYATLRLRVSINATRRFLVCTPGAACVHTAKLSSHEHWHTAVTRVLRNCFAHRRHWSLHHTNRRRHGRLVVTSLGGVGSGQTAAAVLQIARTINVPTTSTTYSCTSTVVHECSSNRLLV